MSTATDVVKNRPEASSEGQRRLISSSSLFVRGSNEIMIEHQGEQYRLRQTRNGKLILTK